jgi:hypothetical protein
MSSREMCIQEMWEPAFRPAAQQIKGLAATTGDAG